MAFCGERFFLPIRHYTHRHTQAFLRNSIRIPRSLLSFFNYAPILYGERRNSSHASCDVVSGTKNRETVTDQRLSPAPKTLNAPVPVRCAILKLPELSSRERRFCRRPCLRDYVRRE